MQTVWGPLVYSRANKLGGLCTCIIVGKEGEIPGDQFHQDYAVQNSGCVWSPSDVQEELHRIDGEMH